MPADLVEKVVVRRIPLFELETVEACQAAETPVPEFRHDTTGLWVEFRFSAGTTQEKILALLKTTPTITRRQLAEQIGITDSGVKYHLHRLRSSGIIRHVGSTKAGHWEILK